MSRNPPWHAPLSEKLADSSLSTGAMVGPYLPSSSTNFNLHCSLTQELNCPQSYGYRPLTTLSLSITESESAPPSNSKPSGGSNSTLPNWVNGPVRSPRTIGTRETTAQVHPQLFTRTLISKAIENYGVEVVIRKLESVEVEETQESRVRSVVLDGG